MKAFRLLCLLFLLTCSLSAQGHLEGLEIITDRGNYDEGHPQITPDGNTLYFTRGRHPRNQGANNKSDIWLKQKQADGSWGRALNAGGPINSFADDQLIGLSADGRRLAVLRKSINQQYHLDILEKGERSWRIVRSENFSDIPTEGLTATFEINSNEIVYSRQENGQYELFLRQLLPTSGWGPETKLGLLNSAEDERYPYRSPDGNSLYFRRNNNWQLGLWLADRNTFGADRPISRDIPSDYQHISISVVPSVQLFATASPIENNSQLLCINLPSSANASTSKLLSGTIQGQTNYTNVHSPAIDVFVAQRRLTIYPDHNGHYTIVVPVTTKDIEIASSGYFISQNNQAHNIASSTSSNDEQKHRFSEAYYQREQQIQELHQRISITTNEVAKLQADRKALKEQIRQEQLAAGQEVLAGYIDPELAKLRSQVSTAQLNLRDTLPPDSLLIKKPTIRREDNAQTIDELTALRNRFRAAKQALGAEDWTTNDPVAVRKSAARQLNEEIIPTISQDIARGIYAEQQIDSLAMEQNIRSSLFATNRPAVYEREPWENELIENIDPATKQVLRERLQTPIANSTIADQALQQALYDQQNKLQRLKDSLDQQFAAQLREESTLPTASYTAPVIEPEPFVRENGLTAKGGEVVNNGNSTTLVIPFTSGRTITLQQLRFGPNSAIIKPGSEVELIRLVNQLEANPQLRIEIGVHANSNQSYLAASRLSKERAERIAAFLISQGCDPNQIVAIGYGREHPLVDDRSPEGRLRNQRVEIKVF